MKQKSQVHKNQENRAVSKITTQDNLNTKS